MKLSQLKLIGLLWVVIPGSSHAYSGPKPISYLQEILSSQQKIGDCTIKSSLIYSDENYSIVSGITITFTKDGEKSVINYNGEKVSEILHPIELMDINKDSKESILENPYVEYRIGNRYHLKIYVDPKVTPAKIIGMTYAPDFSKATKISCGATDQSGRINYEKEPKEAPGAADSVNKKSFIGPPAK